MSLNGDLQEFELSDVLQLLSRGHHTGVLSISAQCKSEHGFVVPTSARIYFRDGKVAFASAGLRQRLGHRLLERGLLTREALRSLLDKQKLSVSPKPFGAMLVDEKILCPEVVTKELQAQILQVLQSALEWRTGEFRFEKQALTSPVCPASDHMVSVERVLLEIHRQSDEEAIAAAAAWIRSPEAAAPSA